MGVSMLTGASFAAPVPDCSTTESSITASAAGAFTATVTLENTGDSTGYAPTVSLMLPQELTLLGTQYRGETLPVFQQEVSSTGTVIDALTGQAVAVPIGQTYAAVLLPEGSLPTAHLALSLDLTLAFAPGVPLDTPLSSSLQVTCGFARGATAADDPIADPALSSGPLLLSLTPSSEPPVPPTSTVNALSLQQTVRAVQRGGVFTQNPSPTDPLRAGDMVTYSLTLQQSLPIAATEITLSFPTLFIEAASLTSAGTSVLTAESASSVPAVGELSYGPATLHTGEPLPLPLLMPDAVANTALVSLPDTTSLGNTLELLYTVQIADMPAIDRAPLLVSAAATNAVGADTTGILQTLSMPSLRLQQGIIATTDTGAVFLPVNRGPVPFNPMSNPLAFSDGFVSEDLTIVPIDSNVAGASGGARMRYAVLVENQGSAPAYNITLSDSLSAMQEIPLDETDVNIRVLSGAAVDRTAAFTGGLFGYTAMGATADASNASIQLTEGRLEGLSEQTDRGGSAAGENILLLSYDLQLKTTTQPLMVVSNAASLVRYTAVENSPQNYITSASEHTDFATVSLGGVTMEKRLLPSTVQDLAHTDSTLGDATIGEMIRYQLRFTAPEGDILTPRIVDYIPDGMAYYKPTGVLFNTTCGAKPFVGSIPPLKVPGTPPFPIVPSHQVTSPLGTTGIAGSGEPLRVEFNSNISVTPDGDPDTNTFCMEYEVVVLDMPSNNGLPNYSTLRTNEATLEYGSLGQSIGPVSTTVNIVEPELAITQTITPAMGEGGDTVTITSTVQHTSRSSADAFDVRITNGIVDPSTGIPMVPERFIIDADFANDGIDNDGDGLLDAADPDEVAGSFYDATTRAFRWDQTTVSDALFQHWPMGSTRRLAYRAVIDQSVVPNEIIDNNATVVWDTVPGESVSPLPERQSAAGAGASFRVRNLEIEKTAPFTSAAHTGQSTYLVDTPFLAIGEQVTFRVRVAVPAATMYALTIADIMPRPVSSPASAPDFFRVESVTQTPTDIFTEEPTITLSDTNADGNNDRFDIVYPLAIKDPSATDTHLEFLVVATVLNTPATRNLMTLRNTAYVYFQNDKGVWSSPEQDSQDVQFVVPRLTLEKSADTTEVEAGDVTLITLTYDHHNASSAADAFHLQLVDALPPEMRAVGDFGTDGVDNDGDGAIDEADEAAAAFFDPGTQTLTFNDSTTDNPAFTQYKKSDAPITIAFYAQFTAEVRPATQVTNTATLTATTLPEDSPDARTISVSDHHNFTIEPITIEKYVANTSNGDTGTSAYTPTLTDLALGEEVTYHIPITVPESTMTAFTVVDTLPPFLEALGGEIVSTDGITHTMTAPTLEDSNGDGTLDRVIFALGTVRNDVADDDTETLLLSVTARLLPVEGVPAGRALTNTVTATYSENPHPPYTASAVVEPLIPTLRLEKTASPLLALPGEDVTYTLTVTNIGNAPAYDLTLTDPLTPVLHAVESFASDGRDETGNGVADDAPEDTAPFYDRAEQRFLWDVSTTNNDAFARLLPGEQITLQFLAELDTSVTPASNQQNTATLQYQALPGPLDAAARPAPGMTFTTSDDAVITVPFDSSVTKDLRDDDTEKRIGDTIPYTIRLQVQEGVLDPVSLTDTLPAGLAYLPGTLRIGTSPSVQYSASVTDWDAITPASEGITTGESQTLELLLGRIENTDTDPSSEEYLWVDFDALVMNTADNAEGTTHQNAATVNFAGTVVGPVLAPVVTVHEPQLSIHITPSYTGGSTVLYTVTIASTGTHSADEAFDLDLWTLFPPELTYNGDLTLVNGHRPPTEITTGLPHVQWQLEDFPPLYTTANPYTFTFTATVGATVTAGQSITVPVDLPYTSQPGAPGERIPGNPLSTERTGDTALGGGAENDYRTQDSATITLTRADLRTSLKTVIDVNGGLVQPGDTLRYRLEVVNTGNVPARDVLVSDSIPAQTEHFTWVIGPDATVVDESNTSTGGEYDNGLVQLRGFTLAPLAEAPENTRIFEYTVTVVENALPHQPITNAFTATTPDGPGGEDSTTTTVEQPELSIVKSAFPSGPVHPGDLVTYTVTVQNTGNAPASNVLLTDPLPDTMRYVPGTLLLDDHPLTDAADADAADYNHTSSTAVTLAWPSLAVEEQLTLRFTVQMAALSGLVTNTATVRDDTGRETQGSASVLVVPEEGTLPPTTPGTVPSTPYVIRYSTPPAAVPTTPTVVVEQEDPKEPDLFLYPKPTTRQVLITHAPVTNDLERVEMIPQTGGILQEALAASRFTDALPTDAAYLPAIELTNQGYIQPNADRAIRLSDAITRAEAVKLIALGFKQADESIPLSLSSSYTDVPDGHWALPYMHYAAEHGLMQGYGNGSFGPEDSLTLSQAAVVLSRVFGITPQQTATGSHWAEGALQSLRARGVLTDELLPEATYESVLSRGQFFTLFYRLLELRNAGLQTYFDALTLTIPSLEIEALPVRRGLISEPSIWKKALDEGAVFYQYKQPGNRGKIVLFGHSFSNPAYAPARYAFTRLIKGLHPDDTFEITIDGITHLYQVTQHEVISAEEVRVLESFDSGRADMVLFTCDTTDLSLRHVFEAVRLDSYPAHR
ncbi:DUF11 domain-containing protein [Candidatus Peribacteria bacterium]|nr:DUF11 domain-containing protein [Candidatus Peribacteria bacterium]